VPDSLVNVSLLAKLNWLMAPFLVLALARRLLPLKDAP
jgi:hypothetical protein